MPPKQKKPQYGSSSFNVVGTVGSTNPSSSMRVLGTVGPVPTVRVNPDKISFAELKKLKAQVDRQEVKVELLGGKVKKHKPGLLERAFDVISRPQYMLMEAARGALAERKSLMKEGKFKPWKLGPINLDVQTWDDALKGGWAGLSGKKKTSGSQLLGEYGVKNKAVKGIGGFALDIGAGMLTPGVGAVAKGGRVARAVKATEASLNAASRVTMAEKAIQQIVGAQKAAQIPKHLVNDVADLRAAQKLARNAAIDQAAQKGTKLTSAQLKAAEKKAVGDHMAERMLQAQRAEMANLAGQVELRVLGHPILKSEKLYETLARPAYKVASNPAVDTFLKAFSTQRAMTREIHGLRGVAINSRAAEFEGKLKALQGMFKGTTKSERAEIARRIENGTVDIWSDARLRDIAKRAKGEFDSIYDEELAKGLVGYSNKAGVTQKAKRDNYVYHVYRNQKEFKLRGGKKVGSLSEAKAAGFNPVEDVADMLAQRYAKHFNLTTHDTLMKDVAERFGINPGTLKGMSDARTVKALRQTGHLVETQNVRQTSGYLFNREIAEAVNTMNRKLLTTEEHRLFLKMFDRVQRSWKGLVTTPNPGFHVRNLMGDMWNNFMDGTISPKAYHQAGKIITNGKTKVRIGNHILDEVDLKELYEMKGLKSSYYRAEEMFAPAWRKGPRKVGETVRNVSEAREDFSRMAHFIDAMKKEVRAGKSLEKAADAAAARVRKFNFDYMDLTDFEKSTLRRVIPFYTWMRKNVPLQLEMLASRPDRVAVLPKGMRAVATLLGTDPGDEPLAGVDSVIPRWLKDQYPLLVKPGDADQGINPVYMNPRLPISDIGQYFTGLEDPTDLDLRNPLKALVNSTNPIIKMIYEQASGESLFTGEPLEDSFAKYLLKQTPIGGQIAQSMERDPAGSEAALPVKFLNWFYGAGIQELTPQMRKGALRQHQDELQRYIHDWREKQAKERSKVGS